MKLASVSDVSGVSVNDQRSKILIIDDDPGIHKALSFLLQSEFSVYASLSAEKGIEKAKAISPDLILLDLNMPRMGGIEALEGLIRDSRSIPIIILTAYGSVDSAVRAIKLGAVDYIQKPFDNHKLKQVINETLKRRKNFQNLLIRQEIIGESPKIKEVWQMVEKYGPTDLPILIYGETGTGKELFAKAVHEISKRSHESFVPIDCSAIPESLVESEIFGYEKGAFTGADISKPGRLDWADKGTFYLDDISDLPLIHQAKLLRVIQEQQYVPLGARKPKSLDVRFISSSNVDLKESIKDGIFREDLYYRITGVCLELPPLRERRSDIELLVSHFINKYSRKYNKLALEFSDEAMKLFLSYQWPGNVRELEWTIASMVISTDKAVLPEHLPSNFRREISVFGDEGGGKFDNDSKVRIELSFKPDITQPINLKRFKEQVSLEAERQVIAEVKRRFSFNQIELAKFLGVDPKTLRAKEKKL